MLLREAVPVQKGLSVSKPKKKLYQIVEPYLFLLPALLIFAIFLYYPFGRTIYLST